MRELAEALLAEAETGRRGALCVVVESTGSVPRRAGAKLAVLAGGRTLGTVGGGETEYGTIQMALACLETGQPLIRTWTLAGGSVTILILPLGPEALETLRRWRDLMAAHRPFWLRLAEGALEVREGQPPVSRPVWREGVYLEPAAVPDRVVLFGGGHVAQALTPVLARVGFRVTVFDQREALARREVFPQAEQVILGNCRDIAAGVTLTASDYAVVMTPDHQTDFEILAQVLRTGAGYIGCLGSRRKAEKCRALLAERGFSPADIGRIRSPIGLPILAETPEELAVSIAGELIAHRARRRNGAETEGSE